MPKMIFVNLPVKDLAAAIHFYEAIGCRKNEQFSDHQAASMVWSARLNGLDPQAYLADVIARIDSPPARRLSDLLPWWWSHKTTET